MNVVSIKCKADELQSTIQEAKDNGRRILAVSPSKMVKPVKKNEFEVTEFVVISQ